MRVLHVVESLGGGVLSAVLTMVDATPEIDHHLMIWPRRAHADTGDRRAFASVGELPTQPLRALHALRLVTRALGPDVLHAHSSYAGFLTRALDLGVGVVYSPHCFGFERSDIRPVARAGVWRTEHALVRHTAVLAACSPHEAVLAERVGHRVVVTVPNRALDPPGLRARYEEPLRVVAVGRIGAQKDWRYLLDVKRCFDRRAARTARWEWLGSGDVEGEAQLRSQGVTVTGWLPREQVVRRLAAAQVYLHTAAWEGAPVSVLEASAVGLPIAARRILPLVSLGVPGLAGTVESLATRLIDLQHDPTHWTAAQAHSSAFAAAHSAVVQRERLTAAYQRAPAALVPR